MFRVRELSEADETFKRMQNSSAFKTCNSCATATKPSAKLDYDL